MTSKAFTSFAAVKNNTAAVSTCPLRARIDTGSVTSRISKTTQPLQINYTFFIKQKGCGIINSKWIFKHLFTSVAYRTMAGFCGCKGIFN